MTSPGFFPSDLTESPSQNVKPSHFERAILGILVGASVFAAGLIMDPILSIIFPSQTVEGQIDASYPYTALALVVVGLCILFTSATAALTNKSSKPTNEIATSVLTTLRKILSEGRYSRLLVLSAVVYAIFYSLVSGVMVYNPNVSFSSVYHVSIPSWAVATCCSPLGQTPLAEVILTEHIGLLLVPVNLLLLFSTSWLVGLNVAIAAFVLSVRFTNSRIGWFGGLGALAGLFTSCPTCAGLATLSILGETGTLSAALLLGPLQTFFVGVSLPMLVATPILSARSIRSLEAKVCRQP